jgi:CBS domain-containing protein
MIRLLHSRSGSSAIEYSIILALIVLTIGGAAFWLAGASNKSLASLSGRLTAPTNDSNASCDAQTSAVSPSGNASPSSAAPGGISLAQVLPAVVVVGAIIGLGLFSLRRQRRRVKRRVVPHDDGILPALAERFVTKRQDLLRLLLQDPNDLLRNQLSVRHLMTTELIVVGPGTAREQIVKVMREANIRHLLVCGPARELLGVVSDRDLRGKSAKTARELMSAQVHTISPDTLMSTAITRIIHAGISSLPVVEDGRLCGMITTTDLVLALQVLLQLWLHATSMMRPEVWQRDFMHNVQSDLEENDAEVRGERGAAQRPSENGAEHPYPAVESLEHATA